MGEEQSLPAQEIVQRQFSAQRKDIGEQVRSSLDLADKRIQGEMLGETLHSEPLDEAIADIGEPVPWESLESATESPKQDVSFQSYFNQEIPRKHIVVSGRLIVQESVSPPFAPDVKLVSFYDQPEAVTIDGQEQSYVPLRHALIVHENRCVDLIKGWRALPTTKGAIRHIGIVHPGSKSLTSPFSATSEPMRDVFFTDEQTQTGKATEFLINTQAARRFGPINVPENTDPEEINAHPLMIETAKIQEQANIPLLPRASHRINYFVRVAGSGLYTDTMNTDSKKFLEQVAGDPQILDEISQQSDAIVEQSLDRNIVRGYLGLLLRLQKIGIPLDPQTSLSRAGRDLHSELHANRQTHSYAIGSTELSLPTMQTTHEDRQNENPPDGEPVVWDQETGRPMLRQGMKEILSDPARKEKLFRYIGVLQGDTVATETATQDDERAIEFALQAIDNMSPEQRQLFAELAEDDGLRNALAEYRAHGEKQDSGTPAEATQIPEGNLAMTAVSAEEAAAITNEATHVRTEAEQMIDEIPPALSVCLDGSGKLALLGNVRESSHTGPIWVHMRNAPPHWNPKNSAEWAAQVQEQTNNYWSADGCLYQTVRASVGDTLHYVLEKLKETPDMPETVDGQLVELQQLIKPWRKPEVVLLPSLSDRTLLRTPKPERGSWVDETEHGRDISTLQVIKDFILEPDGGSVDQQRLRQLLSRTNLLGYSADWNGMRNITLYDYIIQNEELFSHALEGNLADKIQMLMNSDNPKLTLYNPMPETLWIATPTDVPLIDGNGKLREDLTGTQDTTQIQGMILINPQQPKESRYFACFTQVHKSKELRDTDGILHALRDADRHYLYTGLKTRFADGFVDEPVHFYRERPGLRVIVSKDE